MLNIGNNYPSLSQMSMALPIADGVDLDTISRGTLLVQEDGAWVVADNADAGSATVPGKSVFIALHDGDDMQVEMADKMSAISVEPSVMVETSEFTGELAEGDLVSLADGGKFGPHSTGETAYGRVISAAYTRTDPTVIAPAATVVKILTSYNPAVATA